METTFADEARQGSAGCGMGLGAAVDLGTTTIAVSLHDLGTGARLGEACALNPQVAFGQDVLSRVSRAIAGDGDALRAAVVSRVRRLVHDLVEEHGADEADVRSTVVVGNPAMTHLFLGRDVTPLAGAPYRGALTDALTLSAHDAGLPGGPGSSVFVGPAVSAFVGSDAVAGALATGLIEGGDGALLVDLGTNGELVLRAGGRTLAASAAAGPAFEGAGISSGMRAQDGAIDRVDYADGELRISTIGSQEALGVCGTGLIDAVAAMLDAGALDATGRLRAEGPLAGRVVETATGVAFVLAPGIELTQQDVRSLQLAKGAVAAALEILLEEAGVDTARVTDVVVAGAFGSGANVAGLVRIGVFPASWESRVRFAGNSALGGAQRMLLDPAARARAGGFAREARAVPLASRPDFQERFLAALAFPEGA
jgi:uncharacterized 2Fe-2S/4Fe-4S cluster protein (DUF4445 family)